MESEVQVQLGEVVQYVAPKKQGENFFTFYPATIYKFYKDEIGAHVGLLVIFDGIPSRYGKVAYSKEPKELCWMELNPPVKLKVS